MTHVNRPMGLGAALAMVAAQIAPVPLLAPLGIAAASAQNYNQRVNVPCYSTANRTQTCSLPANTQSVSFTGPDRSGICREGNTWRRNGDSIEVRNGCGGNFEATVRGNSGSGGGNWGGNGQGFAGEVTCRSRNGQEQICNANTGGRVEMLQQYSSTACIEGRTWRADRRSITVRAGCQARFGYGYGNNSGGGGWDNGGSWGGNNRGFAGQLECRSDNNRYRRCSANTENRVEMLRQFSSSSCVRGRGWGYDRSSIWVDNGCQARFGYGYGNVTGDTSGSSGGSDTGAVIGGVALAAGLVALLAAAGKSSSNSRSAATTSSDATLHADLAQFPSDARASAQACMNEAARQVGATGGSAVRLNSVESAARQGNGWSIRAQATATYPEHSQKIVIDCTTSGDKVSGFDIR